MDDQSEIKVLDVIEDPISKIGIRFADSEWERYIK